MISAVSQNKTLFSLQPEWEKQSAVMLTWPHENTIWKETLNEVDGVYAEIVKHIALRQKVIITCNNETHKYHVINLLKNTHADINQISIYIADSDDVWVRDHGPITVMKNGQYHLLDFIFNGWGGKYPAENDNFITRHLFQAGAFSQSKLLSLDFVLEGGAVEVDGYGTLLTTKSCLLSKTRNPQFTQVMIEEQLKYYLGVTRILWLEHGALMGDDTDGHIDTLARFIDPHTICYVKCDDVNDPHYTTFFRMESELKSFVDYQGNPYQLIPLPWPKAKYANYDGRRLPLSYANFLIMNDAVLVPLYEDEADHLVLKIFQQCFPHRQIIGIQSMPLVQWYGSIHCMTMQLPEGVV